MAGDRFTFTTYSDDNNGCVVKSDDQKNKKSDGTGVIPGKLIIDCPVEFKKEVTGLGGLNWFTDFSTTGLNNNSFSPLSGFTKNLGKNDIPSKATSVLIRVESKNSGLWSSSYVNARHIFGSSGYSFFWQQGRSADNRPRHAVVDQIWVPVIKNSSGTPGIWLHWSNIQSFLIMGYQ